MAEIIAELDESLGMIWLGEEGHEINAIMAGAVDGLEQVEAWLNHLEQNLTFPFKAQISEWQDGPDTLAVGDRVKVTALHDYFDEHYGVFAKIKKGRRSYDFPLCDLEAVPPTAPNYDLLKLYAVWFANR